MFKKIFDLNRLSTLLLFRSILFFIFTFYGFSKIKTVKFIFVIAFLIIIQSVSYSQWISQSVPVDKPIIGLEFVNANTGWAITQNISVTDTAYILASTNSGSNWFVQYKANVALYSIDAININICYAGASDADGNSIILKTTNGGSNWIPTLIGPNRVADDMFFVNADSGYICDKLAPSVYTTTDGGASWILRPHPVQSPRTLFFLNYNTGYCGGSSEIFKTINSGLNWSFLNNLGIGGRQVLSIQFLNSELGWAGLTNNRISLTTNGGANWDFIMPNTVGSYDIQGLYFVSDSIGWCGPDISTNIYKTTNGGFVWRTQVTNIWGARSITFLDSLNGWTAYYPISKTTNGGLTFISTLNSELSNTFKLYQNYPNPFNPSTKIRFTITNKSYVSISVYNILGKEMFKWESDGSLNTGVYEYEFNGNNIASGVYIYKLTAKYNGNVFSDSKKMIYIK